MRARAIVLLCAVAALTMSGCSSPPAEEPGVSATVLVHSGEASVDTADATRALDDGDVVVEGDVIRVDGDDAIVELTWSDGAVTRLGPATVFTVGQPDARLGTRGTQDGGMSWNRLPASGDAEATSSATVDPGAGVPYALDIVGADRAEGRGPLFLVDCTQSPCRILGTGGTADIGSETTFRRGKVDTVVDSGAPASWGELMTNPWAQENAELDEDADFVPVVDLFADADPSRAVLDGTFDVLRTYKTSDCSGPGCSGIIRHAPGDTRELVYSFHQDCAVEPCSASVDTQTVDAFTDQISDATAPLVAGAEDYTWGTDSELPICQYDDATGTHETGRASNVIRWQVTPSKAEVRNGVFVVTELTGDTHARYTVVEPTAIPGCEQFERTWSSSSDLVLTKREG